MARDTEFDHDQLGHLLSDLLLEVPRFQRSYSWDLLNVREFLGDLAQARQAGTSYFMGTTVFAAAPDGGRRRQIVDGQQRIATTAVLLIAVRDLLTEYGRPQLASNIEKRYLRGFDISEETDVERLVLSPKDVEAYTGLLDGLRGSLDSSHPLIAAYDDCLEHLRALAPTARKYKALINLTEHLENKVQVLVAIAADLSEAYVIFETLNDRGADLTTADLLKNFLFSKAGQHIVYMQDAWVALESSFDRSDDLVRFIRYEYASRHGATPTRKLYRAIQEDLQSKGSSARSYVERLAKAKVVYLALRDPESSYWKSAKVEVRDALLAYRRFGFESSYPVLLAAFLKWQKKDASKLLVKMAKWSVRALFSGNIGAQLSEEVFGRTAVAISSGQAHNQVTVRERLSPLLEPDATFKRDFMAWGSVTTSRAKYLLAMLEKAYATRNGLPEPAFDWASTSITIEHIHAVSYKKQQSPEAGLVETIGNLTLLEKKFNHGAGSKPFQQKKSIYEKSSFPLTREIAQEQDWGEKEIGARARFLAELACVAWPDS